jgi:hypothetical protein
MIVSHASRAVQQPRQRWGQFSLRTALLVTTLVAVGLGLMKTAVALGIAFVVASPAALVRTVRAAAMAESDRRPMGTAALVGTFVQSLAILVSMMVAWLCTIVVGCLAAGLFGVIVVGAVCRFLATYLGRICQGTRWIETRVLRGVARCTAVNRSLNRRFWLLCE